MSLTTGLIHPGDKFLNVEPKRAFRVSQAGGPLVTYTLLEDYSAGEIVWWVLGSNSFIRVITQNLSVGDTFTQNFSLPPNLRGPVPYIDILTSDKNVNAFNNITSTDWNRLSLSSQSTGVNNVELIRIGVSNDYGAVVYNTPISNDWLRLNITCQTSISGSADILWLGLITDPAVINQTAISLWQTSGLFGYTNIFNNRRGFRKATNNITDFDVFTSATSDKTGRLNISSLTFERETIASESIRVTGSVNGLSYTSTYQANALPITGESYIAVGAQSGGLTANMTVGHITYATSIS